MAGLNFKFESAYLALLTARIAFQNEEVNSAMDALEETIEHLNDIGVRDLTFLGFALGQGSEKVQ